MSGWQGLLLREPPIAVIVEKYPEDKTYDFNTGDLRGIVEVIFQKN
jgi:hypothetical protein